MVFVYSTGMLISIGNKDRWRKVDEESKDLAPGGLRDGGYGQGMQGHLIGSNV